MASEQKIIEEIKNHLKIYKNENLKIKKNGSYNYKGNILLPDHVLPKESELKNIIEGKFNDRINPLISKKHHLFHHLNSSQALCLNLFGPLVLDEYFHLFNSFLNLDLTKKPIMEFEYSDDLIKDQSQFDFFLESENHRLYFEFKYTEATYHTQSKSTNNDERWNKLYSKPMATILTDKNNISKEKFFTQYQLWRNICRISNDNCEVYFVLPKFRTKLIKQINDALKLIKPEFQNKVHIITIEKICETILKDNDINIKDHFNKFKEKYISEELENTISNLINQ